MSNPYISDVELDAICAELNDCSFDEEDTLVDAVIPLEKEEEEWEMQSCENWIKEYNEAKALNNLRVIEHWFYFEPGDGTTRVRGIYTNEEGVPRIVTTSPVEHVLNDVLWTESGSKYQLVHQINGETVDDICSFWPMSANN